jgi:hypothetical protein
MCTLEQLIFIGKYRKKFFFLFSHTIKIHEEFIKILLGKFFINNSISIFLKYFKQEIILKC